MRHVKAVRKELKRALPLSRIDMEPDHIDNDLILCSDSELWAELSVPVERIHRCAGCRGVQAQTLLNYIA